MLLPKPTGSVAVLDVGFDQTQTLHGFELTVATED